MIKYVYKPLLILLLACSFAVPAQAASTNHVNIAAFHKNSDGYEFKISIAGRFSDFIAEMEKGSQIMFLYHTSDMKNNDVITFNADVLREGGEKEFSDDGANCSFSFSDESDADTTAYSVGGMCTILMSDHGKQSKVKAIIPAEFLPDTSQGVDVWMKLYEDKKTGIAIYANVSK